MIVGVVSISWARSGEAGVRYLTSQFGCSQHEPTSYYLEGAKHGPQAVWLGSAVERLGFQVGQAVTTKDAMIVLAHGCDPAEFKILMAQADRTIREQGLTDDEAQELRDAVVDQARLGRAPYQFKTPEEKLAQWVRAETRRSGGVAPDPERVAAQKAKFDAAKPREARPFVDLTFSAQKSVSVYHAALLAANRVEDADKLMAAFHSAIDDALKYAEKEAGYSRAGRHSGGGKDRPSTGLYVDTGGFVAARWDHHTSREGDPQLHAHMTIRNNVPWLNPKTGQVEWLALDGRALHEAQRGIAATFTRSFEERLVGELLVELELRPDGKSREIVGISQEVLAEYSTRRGQIDARVAKYVEKHAADNKGAKPSKYLLYRMSQAATLRTRKPKDNELTLKQLVSKLAEEAQGRIGQELSEVLASVESKATAIRAERESSGQRGITAWDLNQRPELRERVIRAAVERVQTQQATFTRKELMFALEAELPLLRMNGQASAAVLESLANEAIASPQMVKTDGFELFPAPAELTRTSDGKNIYRPHYGERYATVEHMTKEERLVAYARNTEGAARLDVAGVEARIEQAGLVAGQAEAVRGVLTDGRALSVIVGPAGAGKTTVTRNIREGWEHGVGGRVIGITPSSVSAKELADAGINGAVNSSEWITAIDRGRGREFARLAPRANDLVIVDEAGMMSTDDLHRIVTEAQARGAKVVMVGDPAQLSAVEAGGMFRLLAADSQTHAYELDEVYRLREADGAIRQWEADASLGLREGDAAAIEQYRWRGRVRGGTAEEMAALIANDYLTDVDNGRESVVLAGSNERAEEIARVIRERLIQAGIVDEADGTVPIWGDQQRASKGDLIQARKNDHAKVDSQGDHVLNRYAYRVLERHEDGSLTVARFLGYDPQTHEDRLGGTITLDPQYLQEKAVLAYAGTVHSAQGRTVRRGYVVIDEQSTRELLYVGMTRGWERNDARVISKVPIGPEQLNALDVEPTVLMREALERDKAERSAIEVLRDAQEWVRSGPPNAAEWALHVEEHTTAQADALMRRLLSAQDYARLQAEDPASVYRAARSAELRGHDFEAVLTEAVNCRQLDTAETVAATLKWRIERLVLPHRQPESIPATDWASRTPQIDGPKGAYLARVADALDERQAVLGSRAVDNPPAWALERLGPVPEDAAERAEWERRIGAVEIYREIYGVPDDRTVIGRPPSDGAVVQHAVWEAAWEALGSSEQERRLAEMSDRELLDAVDTWHRHQEWAPRYVAEEMSTTGLSLTDLRREAELARVSAARQADPDARVEAEQQAAGFEELARAQDERMAKLEEIQAARDLYWERTAMVRENADAALVELERRGVDVAAERGRRSVREWLTERVESVRERLRGREQEPEQLALFEVDDDRPAPAAEPEAAPESEAAVTAEEADSPEQLALFELTEEQLEQQAELARQQEEAAEAEREAEAEPEQEERDRDQEQEREREQQPEQEPEAAPRELDVDAELERARAAVLRLAVEDAPELPEVEQDIEPATAELDAAEVEQAEPELVEAEHGESKAQVLEILETEMTHPELDLSMELE